MSAEDQPQRPRNRAGTRWNRRRPRRPTRCGWCSAHTAALREKSSRRARILKSCSTGWQRRSQSGARRSRRRKPRLQLPVPNCPARRTLLRPEGRAPKSSRHVRILQGCSSARRSRNRTTWDRYSSAGDFPWSVRGRLVPVPEGPRRKLAGGKPAPAGAAPGCHAERAMPQRGIGEIFGGGHLGASPSPSSARADWAASDRPATRTIFIDAPLGHGNTRPGFRGRRPRARTCPRPIFLESLRDRNQAATH